MRDGNFSSTIGTWNRVRGKKTGEEGRQNRGVIAEVVQKGHYGPCKKIDSGKNQKPCYSLWVSGSGHVSKRGKLNREQDLLRGPKAQFERAIFHLAEFGQNDQKVGGERTAEAAGPSSGKRHLEGGSEMGVKIADGVRNVSDGEKKGGQTDGTARESLWRKKGNFRQALRKAKDLQEGTAEKSKFRRVPQKRVRPRENLLSENHLREPGRTPRQERNRRWGDGMGGSDMAPLWRTFLKGFGEEGTQLRPHEPPLPVNGPSETRREKLVYPACAWKRGPLQ